MSSMKMKSKCCSNIYKRNTTNIRSNSLSPRNILVKLLNKKILTCSKISSEFYSNKNKQMKMKTVFKSKGVNNKSKMRITKNNNSSPKLRKKERKKLQKGLLRLISLAHKNNWEVTKNLVHRNKNQRMIKTSTKFSFSYHQVLKIWILKFYNKFCCSNNSSNNLMSLLK